MTHVATAVIRATNVPNKRQQSFAIKNRIELFENRENTQGNDTIEALWKKESPQRSSPVTNGGPDVSREAPWKTSRNEVTNGGPNVTWKTNRSEANSPVTNGSSSSTWEAPWKTNRVQFTNLVTNDEPSLTREVPWKTNRVQDTNPVTNGESDVPREAPWKTNRIQDTNPVTNGGPSVFRASPWKPDRSEASNHVITVNGGPTVVKATEKQQRYRNVIVKAPSINISVAPWTPGAKIVTDSDQDEVQRILAHRRKLIDSSIEAAETQKPSKEVEFRPLSLDLGDETNRESSGASLEVAFPHALDLARHNLRLLWRDVRGVVDAGLSENLEKDARTRQEAKFELMLSEGSFLHGLNSLKSHYMRNIHKHIPQVVTEKDYELLFKHVEDLRLCSEAFLSELNDVWQSDPMLNGMYAVVTQHTSNNFQAYVRYCRNMVDMSSHLRSLTANNKSFAELLTLLTSREGGQRLTLDAFLTAPMQRITKLPLLLRTIMDKTEAGSTEHTQCSKAYEAASKIAQECDEVVNERKRLEEVLRLSQEIEFAEDTRAIPIVSPTRALVGIAYVKHFAFRDGAPRREKLHLILFNDLLLVTKKKSEVYIVVDWCLRDELSMKEVENGALYGKEDAKQTNPVVFTMLNNSQDKKLDLVVTFKDQTLRKDWLAMLSKEETDESEEEQMIALYEYNPTDESELTLSPGDVIKVLAEPDEEGWCLGELLSDGSRGRFPVDKTTKIKSPRVKAANLKANKEVRAAKSVEEEQSVVTPDNET